MFWREDMLFPIAVLIAAYLMDLVLGDPEWLPHPIRWIGSFIACFEDALMRVAKTPFGERALGAVLTTATVGLGYGVTALILYASSRISMYLSFALSVYAVWACLSIKSLEDEAMAVARALREDGINAGRRRLSRIVGRDTQNLSKDAVMRATAETVAENASDGVVAPLFYFMLGGPALMMAYKAINTLDSMVGYKNERYRNFGFASARLDDIANYVPARITAMLMVCASFILRYNWKGAFKTVLRDGGKHLSPNSGMPEAAVAGALGVRFGGPSYYSGIICEKPFIGEGGAEFTPEKTASAVRLMKLTSFIMIIAVCALSFFYSAL